MQNPTYVCVVENNTLQIVVTVKHDGGSRKLWRCVWVFVFSSVGTGKWVTV